MDGFGLLLVVWSLQGSIGMATGILFGITNVVIGHVGRVFSFSSSSGHIGGHPDTFFMFLFFSAIRYDQDQNASSERLRIAEYDQIVCDRLQERRPARTLSRKHSATNGIDFEVLVKI